MQTSRREFALGSAAAVAFAGLAHHVLAAPAERSEVRGYGPLVDDPKGVLDLPKGFSYRTISSFGETMSDGFTVPDRADGMGAFDLGNRRVALVRNHELSPANIAKGPLGTRSGTVAQTFDRDKEGRPLPGGTTTIVYNLATGQRELEYLSLVGTIRNCAGGTTPWGSWLSCEESVERGGKTVGRDHGWVFEVPARHRGLVAPVPLTALGRFNHEAATVDPRTGIVYLTEDRPDGLFYRLLPATRGALAEGGRLQALGFREDPQGGDTRNWGEGRPFPTGTSRSAIWIDLDGTDSAEDDLRARGFKKGAAKFARGEGIEFGGGVLYFTCTSGGAGKHGQVFRYRPSPAEGTAGERDAPGSLDLFVESPDSALFDYGDNLTIAPWGHLIVCEDRSGDAADNYLRGITPEGKLYSFARLRVKTEPAGVCFAPDGRTMFVNVYSPTQTLAITGPWKSVRT